MTDHAPTLRAVARDTTGVPAATDRALTAAKDAGFIAFAGWPSGRWKLTPAGRSALNTEAGQ